MPNRIIKEGICYSADLDKLSAFEETVFYRMIVRVDDYGRIDARPGFLKSQLFTTKNGVTEKNVSEAVAKLASIGLVRLYEVDRKPFLCLPKWHLHQRIRDSRPRYPEPLADSDFKEPAASCGELPRVAAYARALDSDSDKDTDYCPEEDRGYRGEGETDAFSEFWAAYPKKRSRNDALKAWKALKPSGQLVGDILHALAAAKGTDDWRKEGGKYIPYPAKWLRARAWEDEYGVDVAQPRTNIDYLREMYERETGHDQGGGN